MIDYTQATYYKHSDNKLSGESLVPTIIVHLQRLKIIPQYRAILFKGDNNPFKSGLWIDLQDNTCEGSRFVRYHGLWIIQSENNQVLLYGCRQIHTQKSYGGQAIHDIDILNSKSPWLTTLANHLSLSLANRVMQSFNSSRSSYNLSEKEVVALFYDIELNIIALALNDFIQTLDPQITAYLQETGIGDNAVYNFYKSDNKVYQRNRLQAAESFSYFAQMLRYDYKLKTIVDYGKPLIAELASHYQVKSSTINLFRKLKEGFYINESTAVSLKNIDLLPEQYQPKNQTDYMIFSIFFEPLFTLAKLLNIKLLQIVKPFSGGWQVGKEKLEKALGKELEIESIFTMINASFYYGILPLLKKTKQDDINYPSQQWYQHWFAHYGLKKLLVMAFRWEKDYGIFSLKRLNISFENKMQKGILKWPALLPSNYCHGPYRVIELTSIQDLETEGRKLQHCVASYAHNCLICGSYVYSIRDRFGNSLSTFEINFVNRRPSLIQHKALNNDKPTQEQKKCVQHFVNFVLTKVSYSEVIRTELQRKKLWGKMQGELLQVNTEEETLTEEEIKQLQELVAFTHPKNVDIYHYFNIKVNTSVTEEKEVIAHEEYFEQLSI